MTEPDWSKCPEATHFDPVDQNFLREVGEALLLFNIKRGWTVPLHTVYGLRVEDCNRVLIKRPEWNGEGLPPVGAVCEHKRVHEWNKVEVFAVKPNYNGSQTALFTYESGCWGGCAEPSLFRPIRTPEQIVAEEREHAAISLYRDMVPEKMQVSWDVFDYKEDFYRAIDAGYRKQVAP